MAADGDAIQDYLGQTTSGRTVPRIFFAKICNGGWDDLKASIKQDANEKSMEEDEIRMSRNKPETPKPLDGVLLVNAVEWTARKGT